MSYFCELVQESKSHGLSVEFLWSSFIDQTWIFRPKESLTGLANLGILFLERATGRKRERDSGIEKERCRQRDRQRKRERKRERKIQG